jgi:hypothetical protein
MLLQKSNFLEIELTQCPTSKFVNHENVKRNKKALSLKKTKKYGNEQPIRGFQANEILSSHREFSS